MSPLRGFLVRLCTRQGAHIQVVTMRRNVGIDLSREWRMLYEVFSAPSLRTSASRYVSGCGNDTYPQVPPELFISFVCPDRVRLLAALFLRISAKSAGTIPIHKPRRGDILLEMQDHAIQSSGGAACDCFYLANHLSNGGRVINIYSVVWNLYLPFRSDSCAATPGL